jgi:hypothetical protein
MTFDLVKPHQAFQRAHILTLHVLCIFCGLNETNSVKGKEGLQKQRGPLYNIKTLQIIFIKMNTKALYPFLLVLVINNTSILVGW